MNKAQYEVVTWWYGRRDYRTGIELLSRYGKNKTIILTLAKQGKENFQASIKKLNYEVTKAVQLDWLHMPADLSPEQTVAKSLADIPHETEIWPPAKVPAPEKTRTLSELKIHLWSLRRETAKDEFRLRYQQRTKAEKENPMPQGAKRDVIEQRINLRKIKLAEIMKLIAADTELRTSINMAATKRQ